jgi:hypothetical protein
MSYFLIIKIFSWIEILSLLTAVKSLIEINRYPMVLIFFSIPISILGFFTLKLNPSARRLNLLLSPLIVFTYACGVMMLLEYIVGIITNKFNFSQQHFFILFFILFTIHIYFFRHPKIKNKFES